MYSEKYKNIYFLYTFHSHETLKLSQFISYKIIFPYMIKKKDTYAKITKYYNSIFMHLLFTNYFTL